MEMRCEMKRNERKRALYRERGGGGGGGGGGGANERFWPINGLKCLLNGWFKKKEKLIAGVGNEGFVAYRRRKGQGDEECDLRIFTGYEILQPAKISRQKKNPPQPTTTPAKQKTKNCEKTNL